MLDRAGNVKVMDFGIARLLDASVTSTGGIIGTPAYMAPEQAEGREIDARTDIYATGLILYELFTGHAAFTGDTPITIALKQIRETPAAPRTHDASISPALDAIILKCLEKDPAARFQSNRRAGRGARDGSARDGSSRRQAAARTLRAGGQRSKRRTLRRWARR